MYNDVAIYTFNLDDSTLKFKIRGHPTNGVEPFVRDYHQVLDTHEDECPE